MKKTFAWGLVIAVALSACGGHEPGRITAPEQPAFDGGGVGFGSGHRTDTTGVTTTNATAGEGDGVVIGSGH
ncbi:hypothetical protein [Longimicrobium sp.]|uniref:hypothetical protein n=1 Tax=Longimicrobium sp. TaxID=2029185 RepID=UPI002E36ED1D|nr:hypothetical protein [Longimicrobium sp.]HEX6040966.1 hypothetical protein [Longimicrobium sp.]